MEKSLIDLTLPFKKCLWYFKFDFFSISQQEVENFKKVHLISREEFDCLTPEPPVDPNQEVPPGPPRPQQSEYTTPIQ